MLITFNCPHCNSELEFDAAESGARVDCPACSHECRTPVPRVGPGTTLGNFAIERRLGSGGMGDVYVARQLSMDRLVALKVLPQALTRKASVVERFRHEVRMSARLEHPHVVTAFEAGEDFGYLYLAMSYVDGEDLRTRLKRDGPLPEKEALTYARHLADALGYAWTTFRMLHRDVKPGNILVDRKGNARIMDLGISKCLVEEEDAELTVSGMLVGTPHYMSPEQATSGAELDCRADIYSLGASLYHLLTGSTPYQGETSTEVLRQLGVRPVPPLRELAPMVSEHCARLVAKMMALSRDQRPASWEAVITDVDRVLAGREPLLVVGEAAVESPTARPAAAATGTRPATGTAVAPARVPPVTSTPPVRAGVPGDSAEFRTPPRIDLRRRHGQQRLRLVVWRTVVTLALAGACVGFYYGYHGLAGLGLRQRVRGLLGGPAEGPSRPWRPPRRAAPPAPVPPAPAGAAPAVALPPPPDPLAVPGPLPPSPGPAAILTPAPAGTASPPPALDAAAERRLRAVQKQAVDEFLAGRPANTADVFQRAAREPALAPLSGELYRAAAVALEGERLQALVRQSLMEDVGQTLTLKTRTGAMRLKLLRLEEGAAVGLRLLPGEEASASQARVEIADLSEDEAIGRLRRYAGKPVGDVVLALALLRAGRTQEALEPLSRLPPLLKEPLQRHIQSAATPTP